MQHINDNDDYNALKSASLTSDLWDTISRLSTDWMIAVSLNVQSQTDAIEKELRFFVLTYASLALDSAVTTGRKAVLRSLYAELGNEGTDRVSAMLECVIALEQRLTRQGERRETEG